MAASSYSGARVYAWIRHAWKDSIPFLGSLDSRATAPFSPSYLPGRVHFASIVKLLPEFIKIDLFLTRDIDSDPAKPLVAFAGQMGARLIAEGVETAAELRVLSETRRR